MTKAEQARIVAWRLRILKHAEEEARHVAQTCRYFGISRTVFFLLYLIGVSLQMVRIAGKGQNVLVFTVPNVHL